MYALLNVVNLDYDFVEAKTSYGTLGKVELTSLRVMDNQNAWVSH